jgi:hypothetical protein
MGFCKAFVKFGAKKVKVLPKLIEIEPAVVIPPLNVNDTCPNDKVTIPCCSESENIVLAPA